MCRKIVLLPLLLCACKAQSSAEEILSRCWGAKKTDSGESYRMELTGIAMLRNEGGIISRSYKCPQYHFGLQLGNYAILENFRHLQDKDPTKIYFGFRVFGTFIVENQQKYGMELKLTKVNSITPMSPEETEEFAKKYRL